MEREKKEANIEKMAMLLRKRATMLDLSCPKCDNILFKMQNGKIYCPSCDKEVIIQKEKDISSDSYSVKQNTHKNNNELKNSKFIDEINMIREVISINCLQLKNLQNDMMIKAKLDILEQLINIYQSLLEINSK